MLGQVFDSQEDLVAQVALVLGHLFATDLHGGLEHKVHVVGAPLWDVRGGPTRFPILVCLVPSVLGSLEVTLQDGLGYEHLFARGAGQVLLGCRPPTAAASANLYTTATASATAYTTAAASAITFTNTIALSITFSTAAAAAFSTTYTTAAGMPPLLPLLLPLPPLIQLLLPLP